MTRMTMMMKKKARRKNPPRPLKNTMRTRLTPFQIRIKKKRRKLEIPKQAKKQKAPQPRKRKRKRLRRNDVALHLTMMTILSMKSMTTQPPCRIWAASSMVRSPQWANSYHLFHPLEAGVDSIPKTPMKCTRERNAVQHLEPNFASPKNRQSNFMKTIM